MTGFTNLDCYDREYHHTAVLYQKEIDAILAVLREVLKEVGDPRKGTVVVYAQRFNQEPQLAISCNLVEGPDHPEDVAIIAGSDNSVPLSDHIAHAAINAIVESPYAKQAAYTANYKSGLVSAQDADEHQLISLILCSKKGRFILSACVELRDPGSDFDFSVEGDEFDNGDADHEKILLAIGEALRFMRSTDHEVKRCMEKLIKTHPHANSIRTLVRTIFGENPDSLPEITAWQEWYSDISFCDDFNKYYME